MGVLIIYTLRSMVGLPWSIGPNNSGRDFPFEINLTHISFLTHLNSHLSSLLLLYHLTYHKQHFEPPSELPNHKQNEGIPDKMSSNNIIDPAVLVRDPHLHIPSI